MHPFSGTHPWVFSRVEQLLWDAYASANTCAVLIPAWLCLRKQLIQNIYLKRRERERARERNRNQEKDHLLVYRHPYPLPIASIDRSWIGQNQDPGACLLYSTWFVEAQILGPFSATFLNSLAGNWVRSRASITWTLILKLLVVAWSTVLKHQH